MITLWLRICSLLFAFQITSALREFRTYSERLPCAMAKDANYPFAYSKYEGQTVEKKGRVNSNLQDFRHTCQVLGGLSKCSICEEIECRSELKVCNLQLQGVNSTDMSQNIPTISDTAWAVNGSYRHDYGGQHVTHFCVFTSQAHCALPHTTDFSDCTVRCFGYGFKKPPVKLIASTRSVTDVYPGMGRWHDDGAVDLWSYPKNCDDLTKLHGTHCTFSGNRNQIPSYNPQGFVFTYAGSGEKGFVDGSATTAQFNGPEDVAIDEHGVMYVADTKNNAIRMVQHDGAVTTLAGKGPNFPGYQDGPCKDATFHLPKGLDVRHEIIHGHSQAVVIVADTGNHRIRKIIYNAANGNCTVSCLTGLCGNNSLSATQFQFRAQPQTGYADGNGLEARFSAPESVTYMDGDFFVVADTGNFLLRWVIASNGTTQTLAGTIVDGPKDPDGNPLPGCTPPCLVGHQGFSDGNLTAAQFYNPVDVTRGPNNTLWVADEQRIRIVELPNVISEFYTIKSKGRVSTIAGNSLQGHDDGIAQKSNFFYSSGVFVTPDNIAYVVDAATCRVRRITPFPSVAEHISCTDSAAAYIRPSGCTSFDQPVDLVGRKASRVERNIQYNFGSPYELDKDKGKYIKNCVGIPPHDKLDKRFIDITGDNLVVDDYRTAINEDSEQGMAILFNCPSSCAASAASGVLQGNGWYSESSSVCLAAMHDGKLTSAGGLVQITLERYDYLVGNLTVHLSNATQHGLTSEPIPRNVSRVFSIVPFNVSNSMVHTAAGNPSAPLESGCGFEDSLTPLDAKFSLPSGIAARYGFALNESTYIYIADTGNNRIRAVSAVCTQICENGGRCTGPDICTCPTDWTGVDCTKPVCAPGLCGLNSVCVAPQECGCKPGYSGPSCTTPLCQQTCRNNGTCIAPDTCGCAKGWFDSNCTTPVCDNTCANGGNCTAPGKCACPAEWDGGSPDCRIPVCKQSCNNGYCVAPNTCACSPQYTGYDCSVPVCTQGYFQANGPTTYSQLFPTNLRSMPMYKNCDLQSWCNATNEFECDQLELKNDVIALPYGPEYRAITGRKTAPNQCMNIELPTYFKIPFQLIFADNSTTGNLRYSPNSPYQSSPLNAWRGYLTPTRGHTGPWTYSADRQVANVNWLNVTQGLYVCANGGQCVAPDVCACAEGWIGFDCRTPVCNQGYYFDDQEDYVSGLKTPNEVSRFTPFLGNNSYILDWNYSNPNYTVQFEFYEDGPRVVTRELVPFDGVRYHNAVNLSEPTGFNEQGGYRCTIRADTEWENVSYVFEHPNFYSQYMDTSVQKDGVTYTHWVNMSWRPTHAKSRVLDVHFLNWTYAYTNEGYRRQGIWSLTNNATWQYGVCVMEFFRNCSDPSKSHDLQSDLYKVYVQDTDLAYRPRITYNDNRVNSRGRWKEAGGHCVDNVIRGCANNGTCVAPNTCRCATGWKGSACREPICAQTCHHNGNCTSPNVCTCEKGWSGPDCRIPLCAQECQNGGVCVAPDTCQCHQWPNAFRDGRVEGGRPLFQDENGDPLYSGWTGFDCSVPICVQAEKFLVNVPSATSPGFVSMGGHAGDGKLECVDATTGIALPRCPQYDAYVTGNDGKSFQAGCGYDPVDTGCCDYEEGKTLVSCYRCLDMFVSDSTVYCKTLLEVKTDAFNNKDTFKPLPYDFIDKRNNFKRCRKYLSPRPYVDEIDLKASGADYPYGEFIWYKNPLEPSQDSYHNSNLTSNRFLCNINEWYQGDYVDDAGLGKINGAGSIYGLQKGRHVRINTPNVIKNPVTQEFKRGKNITGEGVYQCYNTGSCIAPDTCTCTDGYEGDDCNAPLCRHLQVTGRVSSCLNGGICSLKDRCDCVQTDSVLWKVHPLTSRGLTGWTGTDCSMPMCTQGYYDPFCGDLTQAPGGEGCYRCANNGNCTAPDICTCAKGWTGFDCKTPVCEVVADPLTRTQLGTVFEDKVVSFESDPCGVTAIYGRRGFKGTKYARGNCTQPDMCTCLCKVPYRRKSCHKTGKLCDGPWQDNMVSTRNLPGARAPEFTFGTTDCYFGYEGNVDDTDHFTTCHQTIYVPTSTEKDSLVMIIVFSILGFFSLVTYRYASARLKRRFLLAKIERRRTRRDSEASMQSGERSSLLRQSI